ncbi:DMT family transporter [Salinisphaera sp. T31B1]|uniref:DMT family transporter n=1 Tax=Salinisphaera sp. T31B1 TaxID=727963 RepID=UPI00333F9F0C
MTLNTRLHGMLLTGGGVLVLSPDAILIRLLDTDTATTLFYRGLAMGVGLFLFIGLRDRGLGRAFAQLRQPAGWGLALLFAASNFGFVTALAHTGVADTLGCLATASIFAALFSALFLGERVPLRVWVVSIAIAAGLFLIAIGGTGDSSGRLAGIATAAAFGGAFVIMRATGNGDTLPGLAGAGLLMMLIAWLPASPMAAGPQDIAVVAALAVVLPTAFGLIGSGPRYLPAAEVSLLMLLETVFGTLWAWWLLGESPAHATLLAIVLILGSLALFFARQATASPEADAAP